MTGPDENLESTPHRPDGLELFCTGVLATDFGRRQSNALAETIAQLSQEEARFSWRQRLGLWWDGLRPAPRLAFTTVCLAIIGFCGWLVVWTDFSSGRPALASMCMITDQANARWARGSRMGDRLPVGEARLESGVVELTFNSRARVAVEGPAEFRVTGRNAMELLSGRMSAEVTKPAHGFTVTFNKTKVVDVGTRFGVDVVAGKGTVDVFEGKVIVTPPDGGSQTLTQGMAVDVDNGQVASATYSEAAFPQLNLTFAVHPVNCGFDGFGKMEMGGLPAGTGYWSGPAYEVARMAKGITPLEGRGMLHFLAPSAKSGANDSTVWQVMDLQASKPTIARGGATVTLSAYFDRIHSGQHTGKTFRLAMAAFRGKPEKIDTLWEHRSVLALVTAEKEIVTDDDPSTWEELEVSAVLPADADFMVVEMRAVSPEDRVPGVDPFPGHFADLIDCSFSAPLQKSATR